MAIPSDVGSSSQGGCVLIQPLEIDRIPHLTSSHHLDSFPLRTPVVVGPHIQQASAQNRLRAASTSSVRHLSSASWSGPVARIGEEEKAASGGWISGPPQALPSPGVFGDGSEEKGSDYMAAGGSDATEAVSRTHAFFGTSYASDIPTPPKPLGSTREQSPGPASTMEPLTANPTGPGGFKENGRNRKRSQDNLQAAEAGGWRQGTEARLPSELATDRATSIQSLNRARSLNDRPPSRSNTFFSQTYAVTPPVNAPETRPRGASLVAIPQPGYVSLGIGSSPARRTTQQTSPRAATMPSTSAFPPRPSPLAIHLPTGPVDNFSPAAGSEPSFPLSPPSKLTRESSNIGGGQERPFRMGQILEGREKDAAGAQMETGYRLEIPLGEGAFSVVWAAREVSTATGGQQRGDDVGRLVAIKIMNKRLCEKNDRTRISFLREVAVLKHIRHPQIVSYISSFSSADYHCLVLEHLSGGELFDLVQRPGNRRKMGDSFLSRVFGELCRAVGWLHEAAVVHRDLKLENILLTVNPFAAEYQASDGSIEMERLPRPLIKLSDFGLSRFIEPEHPLLRTRCGSESFAAPEIIMGQPYDGRDTDSWAVGVILFALVAGELPFDEVSSGGIVLDGDADRRKRMMRIARGHYEWPASIVVSPAAKEVVSKLVERDPRKRSRVGEALWDYEWLQRSGVERPGKTSMEEISASTVNGISRILDGFLIHQGQQVEEIAHAEMEK